MSVKTLKMRFVYIDLKVVRYAVIRKKNQVMEEEYRSSANRMNNEDAMASYNIHSRYCIHETSNVVKFLYIYTRFEINQNEMLFINALKLYRI
jgi:hypothetical protein